MTPQSQPPLPPPQKQKSRALLWIVVACAVLLLVVIVVAAGGYAFYRYQNARTANENTTEPESTKQPEATASPAESNSGNSNQSPVPAATRTAWETTASGVTGDATTFTLVCPAGGSLHSVWGSDLYTADSSICTAAVHAGLITFERGGTVTIELRPGRQIYGASERNGVTTSAYGGFPRTFVFKSETNATAEKEADDVTPILWNTPSSILTHENGKTYKFKCPAGGKESSIWGTDTYTADSSVCTAAVHAGVIKFENGGTVTIELRPGQTSYQGTLRNSVKSNDYGAYARSFVLK
ncbi:MAG: LCCL domain-containing protein [Acidobacteriota bacterium]|nr:LCCL domain-containing protein [Acidobacteriota bacterium]